jgi:hypothetical protein
VYNKCEDAIFVRSIHQNSVFTHLDLVLGLGSVDPSGVGILRGGSQISPFFLIAYLFE